MWETATADAAASETRASLLDNVSFEATPQQILAENSDIGLLDPGGRVYVPFLPAADFTHSIAACRVLSELGYRAVPHLPSRKIRSAAEAADWLEQLRAVGCEDLFLVAGDSAESAGPFIDTLHLLDSGVLAEHGFKRLGVAAYPEPHPFISVAATTDALRVKRDYALATGTTMWVVTQFVFQPDIFVQWLERNRDVIDPLPVHFGLPGPSSLSTLLKYARLCGVGASLRMLAKNPSVLSLAGAWQPRAMLETVRRYQEASPHTPLQGCHLFPFGGLESAVTWLKSLKELNSEGGLF